jgi:hypothetical protein
MGPERTPLADRFWPKVDRRDDDDCWPWLGQTNRAGYGAIVSAGHNGKKLQAHRVAYELLVGPIPEGLVIDHLCRNPSCVNPAHMEPVTNADNTIRGMGSTCKRGHPLDGWARAGRGRAGKRYCKRCKAAANRRARERADADHDRR